jgi:hypothetical protein
VAGKSIGKIDVLNLPSGQYFINIKGKLEYLKFQKQ